MKNKLVCLLLGVGIGIGSFNAMAGNYRECKVEQNACLAAGGGTSECKFVYLDCLG